MIAHLLETSDERWFYYTVRDGFWILKRMAKSSSKSHLSSSNVASMILYKTSKSTVFLFLIVCSIHIFGSWILFAIHITRNNELVSIRRKELNIAKAHFGRPYCIYFWPVLYRNVLASYDFLCCLLVCYIFHCWHVYPIHLSCCVRKYCYLVLFVRMPASPTPDRVSRGVHAISCLLICDWIGKF